MAERVLKRMTWEEIQEAFPRQNVGLIECYPDSNNIESAIVKYTEAELSYNEMIEKAFDGEITMIFTTFEGVVGGAFNLKPSGRTIDEILDSIDRAKANGQPVSDKDVVELVDEIRNDLRERGILPRSGEKI